jgi:hypothetical protein
MPPFLLRRRRQAGRQGLGHHLVVSVDWELVAPIGFEDWTRRGNASSHLTEQQSVCLLRCCLPDDHTNGFFVAVDQPKATSTTDYNLFTVKLPLCGGLFYAKESTSTQDAARKTTHSQCCSMH